MYSTVYINFYAYTQWCEQGMDQLYNVNTYNNYSICLPNNCVCVLQYRQQVHSLSLSVMLSRLRLFCPMVTSWGIKELSGSSLT